MGHLRRGERDEAEGNPSPNMKIEHMMEARGRLRDGKSTGMSGCAVKMLEAFGPDAVCPMLHLF